MYFNLGCIEMIDSWISTCLCQIYSRFDNKKVTLRNYMGQYETDLPIKLKTYVM